MLTRPKTGRKLGPPTKKNDAVVKRLIASARLGLPFAIVAQRAGITRETLCQWRSQDATLDRQLDEARAEAAEEAWKKIMAHPPLAVREIASRKFRPAGDSIGCCPIQLHDQQHALDQR